MGIIESNGLPGYYALILALLAAEKPVERLRNYGPSHLNKANLLAIIQRNDVPSESELSLSAQFLSRFGGLKGLARASYDDLRNIHDLDEANMAQVKDAFELSMCLLSFHDSHMCSHSLSSGCCKSHAG